MDYYNPNYPPPDHVVMPLAEYDHMREEISKLFDAHAMIRLLGVVLNDGRIDAAELRNLRTEYAHFTREYG